MGQLLLPPFVSTNHFLDLILPSDRFKGSLLKNLTKEKYVISKKLHTSYLDLDEITPIERKMILKFITEDLQEQSEAMERARKGN